MSRLNKFGRFIVTGAVLIAAGAGLTACTSEATTSDMCAYTQGTGAGGADARVHEIYYPGDKFTKGSDENVLYFPCNARNLRLVPGSTDVLADGKGVGAVQAHTNTGNQVAVELTAYWTLNQDKTMLTKTTIPLLNKYEAASSDSNARNANFSTDGWSRGFLGENFTPILTSTTQDVVASMGDDAWSNPDNKAKIAEQVSTKFMTNLKAATGSTANVVCGSGESSGWSDPNKPGSGTFNCGNIRVVVTKIQPANNDLLNAKAREAQAKIDASANTAELNAAKAKYGPKAEEILGQLDVIEACKEAGMTTCSTNSNGGVTVSTGSGK